MVRRGDHRPLRRQLVEVGEQVDLRSLAHLVDLLDDLHPPVREQAGAVRPSRPLPHLVHADVGAVHALDLNLVGEHPGQPAGHLRLADARLAPEQELERAADLRNGRSQSCLEHAGRAD